MAGYVLVATSVLSSSLNIVSVVCLPIELSVGHFSFFEQIKRPLLIVWYKQRVATSHRVSQFSGDLITQKGIRLCANTPNPNKPCSILKMTHYSISFPRG